MRHRDRLLAIVLASAMVFLTSENVRAQQPTEDQVVAVYIYNFVNFVDWPASAFKSPSQDFVIGVAGPPDFEQLLAQVVSGERYKDRNIRVRLITHPDDATECHMVYVAEESSLTRNILAESENRPILTLSEKNDFLLQGGMVRFFIEDSKVRIEINHEKARDHQLRISSRLLQLAKIFRSK